MARNLNSSVEVCFNEIVDAINAGQSWFVASYFNVSHTRAAYSAAFRMASERGLITKNGSMWMVA